MAANDFFRLSYSKISCYQRCRKQYWFKYVSGQQWPPQVDSPASLIGTASLSEQTWLRNFGLISIVIGAVLCLFANESWAYLLAAAGSLTVLAWPGIVLLKREPSAIV